MTTKQTAKKATKKPTRRHRIPDHRSLAPKQIPAEQGKNPNTFAVGYGKPPIEHQFAPGQSGNPAGTPPSRANLWRHLCQFLQGGEELARRVQQDRTEPLARRIAARQALQLLKKGLAGAALPATMRMWDRDEGRPVAHVVMESPDVLTPEECEEIRQAMRTRDTGC
mgnify:CR=1 FL=1